MDRTSNDEQHLTDEGRRATNDGTCGSGDHRARVLGSQSYGFYVHVSEFLGDFVYWLTFLGLGLLLPDQRSFAMFTRGFDEAAGDGFPAILLFLAILVTAKAGLVLTTGFPSDAWADRPAGDEEAAWTYVGDIVRKGAFVPVFMGYFTWLWFVLAVLSLGLLPGWLDHPSGWLESAAKYAIIAVLVLAMTPFAVFPILERVWRWIYEIDESGSAYFMKSATRARMRLDAGEPLVSQGQWLGTALLVASSAATSKLVMMLAGPLNFIDILNIDPDFSGTGLAGRIEATGILVAIAWFGRGFIGLFLDAIAPAWMIMDVRNPAGVGGARAGMRSRGFQLGLGFVLEGARGLFLPPWA